MEGKTTYEEKILVNARMELRMEATGLCITDGQWTVARYLFDRFPDLMGLRGYDDNGPLRITRDFKNNKFILRASLGLYGCDLLLLPEEFISFVNDPEKWDEKGKFIGDNAETAEILVKSIRHEIRHNVQAEYFEIDCDCFDLEMRIYRHYDKGNEKDYC